MYYEKLSICNVFVKCHDNQSVHCWDVAFFYKKVVENCRCQCCQINACAQCLFTPASIDASTLCISVYV